MAIRIVLADDHQVVREGFSALIDGEPDMEVVGEAADGRSAIELVRAKAPDVVVMDISMPDMNGVEATRRIVSGFPGTKVLALSVHSAGHAVVEMLNTGASGYVVKRCAFRELASAIRHVHAGKRYLSPEITDQTVREFLAAASGAAEGAGCPLSPREREVLQLLAEGWNAKRIAPHLGVSLSTIESHRRSIMRKLKLHTIAELTKYAVREGLTSLE